MTDPKPHEDQLRLLRASLKLARTERNRARRDHGRPLRLLRLLVEQIEANGLSHIFAAQVDTQSFKPLEEERAIRS